MKKSIAILIIISVFACNNKDLETKKTLPARKVINKKITEQKIKAVIPKLLDTLTANFKEYDLVDATLFSDEFLLKIRYATKDNFVDTILYPCAKCLLRYEVLKDLLKAQTEFKSMGYKVKLYDCYRPFSVQKLMWEKVPVVGLVANPATGLRHNRGSAVDISLTDLQGNDIDMGTEHDDLSKKSKTFYQGFSDTVFQNRIFLRKVMEKHNFKGINSEWWHFSHNCGTKYKISNEQFDCN
jgi:D-alanyl-D-alanine dipeptidase